MSSAQLDTRQHLFEELPDELDAELDAAASGHHNALRQQVAERLAAHRARRQKATVATPAPTPINSPARARAARIAATVAERYAHSESYRSFLAAEAETAIRQAEAAAEVAAVTARAVAAAQLDLLESLDRSAQDGSTLDPDSLDPTTLDRLESGHAVHDQPTHNHHPRTHRLAPDPSLSFAFQTEAVEPSPQHHAPNGGLTIRMYEDTVPTLPQPLITPTHPAVSDPLDPEGLALDEEIAFRQSPTFEDPVPPAEIPANLIEFPRQLVAARRARPRRAEGPLLDEAASIAAKSPQLRIFEVEPTQISATPALDAAAPEWSSIMLDAQPLIEPHAASTLVQAEEPGQLLNWVPESAPLLLTASLELRIMAAAVDASIVLAAMLAFAAAVILIIGRLPAFELHLASPVAALGQIAPFAAAGCAAFLVLTALYQVLFFTFSDATPGMNYARIGLCTFSDENPTRAQMRRRALAFLLSAMPCGLGLMWTWIDTDRLTWHDRLSRLYQRSY